MSRWQIGFVATLILLSSATMAQTVPPAGEMPGMARFDLEPVTPEESERFIRARSMPAGLAELQPALAAAPVGPASIAELTRALKNDPDLIYEYVRNNIEYYPVWGIQKGATGAILDNQGTAFDQAALMVALLRQAGFTTSYILGDLTLSAADIGSWLGANTNNLCAVRNLLVQGGVPIKSITAAGGVGWSCPSGPVVALGSITISHAWVKVIIGGTAYHFNPSFKPHTMTAGINLATASGYNATTYLTQARSGATITADTIRGANRTNIRSNLTTYATTLANYLRANKPAATLDDAIGGMTIDPYTGPPLRQTSLPNGVVVTEWTTVIPDGYKPTLRIQYPGIDKTFQSLVIYGNRLTITYNGSNQPVLMLDGVVQATGTAITPGTTSTITFTASHPYPVTQTIQQQIKAGGTRTYLIGNGWGPSGRGVVDLHRRRLNEARAAGSLDTSEVVLGSSLAILGSTWIAELTTAGRIGDRLADTNTLYRHLIGIVGYDTAAYVDLPGNAVSTPSRTLDAAKSTTAFYNLAMHSSILESVAVQQTTGISAVSTVKLVDGAVSANDWIYSATSSNYATGTNIQSLLVNCSAPQKASYQASVTSGYRLILPGHCGLQENNWTGVAYFAIDSTGTFITSAIGGNLAGGFSTLAQPALAYANASFANTWSQPALWYWSGRAFGDPIDMASGNYLYSNDDMKVGAGTFPHALAFQKTYSSAARLEPGPLGKGWSHNFASSVTVGSDGFQGMGEDSALDAVNTLVEQMVAFDLLSDIAKPLDKLVFATLGQRWYGDQLLNNTVIVRQGLNGEVFVKLPDGTYNPPPGNPARLILNPDTTYTYETLNRDKLNFNTAGKIATYNHASGLQVKFTYTGNDLTQVQNSLGRTLTLTNVSGRVTAVGDGTRSIGYAYDGSGNLQTFTDAASKATTFQYDIPGRITKLFYPANPTNPAVTNVYDTLGRVQTQTNANGYLYTYYFAGSRSEEVGPFSISNVSYVDAFGKVLRSINALGKVTLNTYDGQTRLVKTVLPEGNSVTYVYDDAPCAATDKRCTHNVKTLSKIPKPGSPLPTEVTGMTYESAFNKVATVTDPKTFVTSYAYTAQGDPLTVTRPADAAGVQPVSTYAYISYTPSGYPTLYLPASVTEKTSAANSVVTATAYNTGNKYVPLTVTVDSGTGKLNLATTYTYDTVGNPTVVNGPRTDVTDTVTTAYDNQRRPIQVTDALGKLTKLAYDADGNLIRSSAQIGAQWLVSCNTYTPSGKVLKAWGPAQTAADTTCPTAAAPVTVTDYSYTVFDTPYRITENLTAGEGGNRTTEYSNLLDGSLYSASRAIGTALAQVYATYTYTNNGLRATVKDAKNNLTTYQYDGQDRLSKMLYPDKVTAGVSSATDYEQYGYDSNGNMTSLRRRNAQSITLAYDKLNRLLSRSYPATADNVTFGYDLLNRRTASNFADSSYTIAYVWDNAGRLTSAVTNGPAVGSKTLSYQYDAAGNRIRITWPETTPFYVTTTYDALNRPTAIKELGATNLASYAYDDLSRRTTVTLGNSTTTSYAYTPQSALLTLTHDLAGTAQDNTWTYTRNQAQEIVTNTTSNNTYQWTGYANATKSYTPNGLNQYTAAAGAALTYDGNGNLTGDGTWTYGYDQDNQLRSASRPGRTLALKYDALGRMRQTAADTFIVVDLLYDGSELVAEYMGDLLRRYVHGPGIDEPLVWYEESTGTSNKTWLYGDHQGSITAAANSAGTSTVTYTYGPYGEQSGLPVLRFHYTGQQYLEPGLYYYKARFYSPTLGRFMQTDPVGYDSDLNLYAYVGNDPVNNIDPDGEILVQVVGGAVNAGIGAVASFALGEDITLRNVIADFAVGAASSGAAGLGKLAALAQITNTRFGKAVTAGGAEVYKGRADPDKNGTQIGISAAGNAALNASGVIGKVGTVIAQKSGLSIPSNFTANGILSNAFSAPAGVGAGIAIGATANSLGASSRPLKP